MITYDYIVVGGGTAGAIVAARLAEQGNLRVALLEAGPSDENNQQILHLARWEELLGGELDFNYAIEAQARGNSLIRHARGKMLGGSSSHNTCIAFVPPDGDFHSWVSMGAIGWDAEAVQPFFDRLLSKVTLERAPATNPCAAAFVEAAQQAGFPLQMFNQEPLRPGVGWFDLNKRGKLRQSSSVAYLHPLAQWGDRLHILTNTMVTQLLLAGTTPGIPQVIGVQTQQGPIYCKREVILCCGAIDTPKLLLLSGIGPAAHLHELGIRLQAERPGVGENLLDHPEGVVLYQAALPVPASTTQAWEAGLFACVENANGEPDVMVHFGTVIADMHTQQFGFPTATNGFSLMPNVMRARSVGQLRLRTTEPAAAPRLDFRYFCDPEGYDERLVVAGIQLVRRLVTQPALRPWVARELAPGSAMQSTANLSAYARRTSNSVQHPAGTCKMGCLEDPFAVVDPQLRVLGVQGLRIADASVFPTLPSVNPNLTCMMIGERCADFVLAGV